MCTQCIIHCAVLILREADLRVIVVTTKQLLCACALIDSWQLALAVDRWLGYTCDASLQFWISASHVRLRSLSNWTGELVALPCLASAYPYNKTVCKNPESVRNFQWHTYATGW